MTSSRRRLLSVMHLGGLTFREVCLRTWARINEHEILTRAVAISFYALAALVPFLALVITLSAWFLPRIAWVLPLVKQDATDQGTAAANAIALLQDLLPVDATSLLGRELTTLREKPPTGIISFGLVALLWLSASLIVAVMDAMNQIIGVHETRPFWKVRLTAMLMTLSQAAVLIVAFVTILYGSLVGVVILMSWLWIYCIELLAAAEFNKVIEDASPLGKPYGQRHENKP